MNKDIYFGLKNESIVMELLKKDFPDICKTPTTSHPYDFISGETYFELKSRRCNHDKYPDTMIGFNKIQFANQPENVDKQFVFLFLFEDGLYKHNYDPLKKYSIRKAGRYDRKKIEVSTYLFIPIVDLIRI
jgi:hypothetical protein